VLRAGSVPLSPYNFTVLETNTHLRPNLGFGSVLNKGGREGNKSFKKITGQWMTKTRKRVVKLKEEDH